MFSSEAKIVISEKSNETKNHYSRIHQILPVKETADSGENKNKEIFRKINKLQKETKMTIVETAEQPVETSKTKETTSLCPQETTETAAETTSTVPRETTESLKETTAAASLEETAEANKETTEPPEETTELTIQAETVTAEPMESKPDLGHETEPKKKVKAILLKPTEENKNAGKKDFDSRVNNNVPQKAEVKQAKAMKRAVGKCCWLWILLLLLLIISANITYRLLRKNRRRKRGRGRK